MELSNASVHPFVAVLIVNRQVAKGIQKGRSEAYTLRNRFILPPLRSSSGMTEQYSAQW